MNRRNFVTCASLAFTVSTSGCVESFNSADPNTATSVDPISEWEFTIVEENPDGEIDEKPNISCHAPDRYIRISGRMWSGNECTEWWLIR
jgi:hypothetical protein